ncbi:beta-glucosidase [Vibrio sp. SM6]|uniref:Beta-glucosidase n=1 Tax=Vibrio agarilyticus TaxID=2726741 RepID=A0A7X8TPB7_9VIBR|nr:glycoside hydrolase family 3 protein [Vibrio agarilyticus]NLS12182.1 beta-glucosidase [Vibrio agarilyticus]
MIIKASVLAAQKALSPLSRQAAAEGIVLLKNEHDILPVQASDNLALFGRCQIDTYRSGTGSGGAVNVPYVVTALDGLRANAAIQINESLVSVYEAWLEQNPFDNGGGGWASEPWFQQEMPLDEATVALAARESNKAVIFIGRTAGEDQDNADAAGSYRLTETEIQMLDLVCAQFNDVIVVMNATNIMDMSWMARYSSVKAVLYSWAAGMEGGHALADVISGAVSPSGHLTDTIAYRLEDYPSSANFGRRDRNCYAEDIYVGYRYFETFCPESVMYEFGYGLSYTNFTQELVDVTREGSGVEETLNFAIEVTNIGNRYSGKAVAQLYVEAPQGVLGKPRKVLVGFCKTETLAPASSQRVHIQVNVADLASYDDSGVTGMANCYVLEAGEYAFHLGDSVRRTERLSFCYSLAETALVERCQEALAPVTPFERMKPVYCASSDTYTVNYEAVPQRTISLKARIEKHLPTSYAITGDKGFKLADVKAGRVSMSEFIAQLSLEELATIVRAEGMCSPKVTPGTASAFGGVSNALFHYGIPVAAAADGPSGIRMDSGHKATQVPIGTLLGCTWNEPLNHELYYLIGQEMQANCIDTLLGPGINIHRHPLNGRNFEYFSEDPFLTGMMAAAQTSGLHRAGVSGTMKHFAANDQETARHDADSVMSQRALREVHVKAFEMAVKRGHASTIMTCYNPVNGYWGASNYDLNTTLLRQEWGFTGIVMTDWWAKLNHPIDGGSEDTTSTSYMIRAQNDLYMVVENDGAGKNVVGDDTLDALEKGTLTLGELQRCAMNICRFICHAPVMQRELKAFEPIKRIAAVSESLSGERFDLHSPLMLNTAVNCQGVLHVETAGVYQVVAMMRYDRDSAAQSACSLSLNDEFVMTLPTNGTQNQLVRVEGLAVALEAGFYSLDFDFVKAGAVLEQLEFVAREA